MKKVIQKIKIWLIRRKNLKQWARLQGYPRPHGVRWYSCPHCFKHWRAGLHYNIQSHVDDCEVAKYVLTNK